MIILLPLEPLELRYTAQWAKQWPAQLQKDKVPFRVINGEKLTDTINVGSVLDALGTNYWKCTQLASLISHIQNKGIGNDDVLLFADLWFPGIEALQYIKNIARIGPKITGVLHAGTWDDHDFLVRNGLRPFFHEIESAWFKMFDLIFVGSQFHKDLILKSHSVDPDKIQVTGLPFYPDEFVTDKRKHMTKIYNSVVFPHRLDVEKHPEMFDALREGNNELLAYCYTRTVDHFTTKPAYYDELAKHQIAVSFADQETFGYAMLEATALGCYPLVPDRLSYREMYPSVFRYSTHEELIEKIKAVGNSESERNDEIINDLAHKQRATYMGSITRMTDCIHTRF